MNKPLLALLTAVLAASTTSATLAATAPLRHLVYTFKVGIQTSTTTHDSGFSGGESGGGGGAGVSDSRMSSADEGQIVVDVTGASADGGLVVSVSETAKNARSAAPTTCVVYGTNLAMICDPNGKVNDEEFSIVRYVGKNFVAPSTVLGTKWQVGDTLAGGAETNAFTVTAAQGGVLTINEDRAQKVSGAHGFDQTITGTIAYNMNYTVPTAVHEQAVRRQNNGAQDYSTVRTFTDLTLLSDSMQGKQ